MMVVQLQNVLIRFIGFQGLIFLLLIATGSNGFAQDPYLIVSFQDGTNDYSGTRDTKLLSGSPNTNYGSVTQLEVDGSPDKSALLFWDVTSIPIGSIIQSVEVTVNVTNTSGSSTYEIYDLKRSWIENEATWNMYASGLTWEIAGADGSGDRGLTALGAIVGSSLGSTTASLNAVGVAVVQSWVDDPSSNHGLIVQDYINHSDGLDFSSREENPASSRPSLTITYLPPSFGSIIVLTPNGGEQWEVGTTQTITWNSTGNPAALDIEYSIDGGGSWQPIVANTFDDGSEPWLVPNTPSNMALIRISSIDGSLSDQSDGVFIINVPSSPSLMIDDVILTEGDGGTSDAVFTVTLTPSSAQTVTVDYNTKDGTALSGSDYVFVAGQLIFSPGEVNKLITVPIYGDVLAEGVESFFVNLSNASNAIIEDDQGTGTIIDNDGIGISFANIGDYGDAGQAEQEVSALIGSWIVDFVLTNGDNNYPDGEALTIDNNIGQYYRDYIDNYQGSYPGSAPPINRFFPSLGNHDWHTVSGNPEIPYPYLDYFTLPGPGILTTGTSGNERYYDFIIGPVHFFALDSDSHEPDGNISTSIQGQWLQAQLASSTSEWNVVFMHHAPFSSSTSHGSDPDMQWPYEAWGADVVFAGHNHTYERILKDDNNDGVVMPYFVNGLGGKNRNSFGAPIPGSHVRYADDYGAMLITADVDSMTFQFYTRTGQLIDTYKMPGGPILTVTSPNGGETWQRGSVQNITWSSFATSGTVRIEYSTDNGLIWNDILATTVDDGTEPWTIPDTATPQALVRISDTEGGGPADQSDAAFTIISSSALVTSFQDGVNGYNGTRDTKLKDGTNANMNFGTDANLEADGSPDESALLYWDVTSIAMGSTIQLVDITVSVTNTSGDNYEIYDLKRAWNENEATWNVFAFGQGWTVPGAGDSPDRGSTALGGIVGSTSGSNTISLNAAGVAAVQSWVDDPSSNHGVIIQDYINNTDGLDFSSREAANVADRPKLIVTYTGTPAEPSLSINNVNVTEGNSGTVNAVFTVSLSSSSTQTVTVNYVTADGTAIAPGDYTAASGLVTFQPGQTSQTVTVLVNGDITPEGNETFSVNLSGAANATISDNQGVATITDDDAAPSLSINDVDVTEGNSGSVDAVFTVSLSAPSNQTVTVNYATADGTAIEPGDYTAASGQVTFQPGQTSQTVTVMVNGDITLEGNETFFVNLSNAVNATIAGNQGTATITNDDTGGGQLVTESFQDGLNGYSGTRDTKLRSQDPTTNFGTVNNLEMDGSPDKSTLLFWDLASIPPGSILQSVIFTVNITDASGHTYEVYELLRTWAEGEATWNQYASGQNWQVAGADGSSDRGSTVLGTLIGGKGLLTDSLNAAGVAAVQGWVDNPSSNHGFIILDYISSTNGLDVSSREDGTVTNRPKLTVTYTSTTQARIGLAGMSNSSKSAGNSLITETLPQSVVLKPNYPNPFNLETRIEYAIPADSRVRIVIYNSRGQQVVKLVDETQAAGYKTVAWTGKDEGGNPVSSGTYFVQLLVDNKRFIRKIVLMK